jgi:hypothetical protein
MPEPASRRLGGAQARELESDAVGPRFDHRPVAVIAEAPTAGVKQHARPEGPLVLPDDALEDAVLARTDGGADFLDAFRFLARQRAD